MCLLDSMLFLSKEQSHTIAFQHRFSSPIAKNGALQSTCSSFIVISVHTDLLLCIILITSSNPSEKKEKKHKK